MTATNSKVLVIAFHTQSGKRNKSSGTKTIFAPLRCVKNAKPDADVSSGGQINQSA